ncbi:hypothetical protein [Blastococcus sp. TF02A-26]|uniref:hypothetical protein n=1 Tax=Blastococcus sp. TF02A-26 TaxID=2250577 RepID=UPI000DE845D5|nr:hypothetical protein [Blastococcus sp. TF02A-26]RBY90714.1 hypothetical protein DQ240_01210 [Blastococcus sp. TF02A-26]
MKVQCRANAPASDLTVLGETAEVLTTRGAMASAPVTLAVSDRVALGIATMFRSSTPSGQVLDRFSRTGTADSAELLDAVRTEQGYASAEGHAVLHCLAGWVRKQLYLKTTTRV